MGASVAAADQQPVSSRPTGPGHNVPMVVFAVLGAVRAHDHAGRPLGLKGPRHREVLGRLLAADGSVVTVDQLIDDLWERPPANARGAVRTFVAALRRGLEPERPARSPSRLLVSSGNGAGYALVTDRATVDARRFTDAVTAARDAPPRQVADTLTRALGWWSGPPYAEFPEARWAEAERARLDEARLAAVELRAAAYLDLGRGGEVVGDLRAQVTERPWRERAWWLLALALYRDGRQGEALRVLREARAALTGRLGVDPGADLRALEVDVLRHAPGLRTVPAHGNGPLRDVTTAWYERAVAPGSRAGLRSTVDLLRTLAVTGGPGLVAARQQRLATILAAERTGDAELTARIIGGYDVPAIWSRSDDPGQARQVTDAAERALVRLDPETPDAIRARLLATIAIETRGTGRPRGRQAADEAERIARRLADPGLLLFALNGVFLHTFVRCGSAAGRDALGAEIAEVAARHGLTTYEILGRLILVQSRSAYGDLTAADAHAAAAERLADQHESPLVAVFTGWYRAMRAAVSGAAPGVVADGYRAAAGELPEAGMPGLTHGLLPLALLSARLRPGRPTPPEVDGDFGPYETWVRPLLLLARGDRAGARRLLRDVPDPPPDHLLEAGWCLLGQAGVLAGDRKVVTRARTALTPAAGQLAGAGSGVLTLGPVSRWLRSFDAS
ncbi:AfsR/SARP family transcriptional regulator [Micromonospora sp. WMMD882]|uniref:AfsR/SARP family transcriptional regulator n=1 Tax=Micromonospora sp. WMMD882 TaxID=3015151 RepID=UPI00248AF115|nr:AfsR/SARP family transcriptional regulator [Micromonospora sp. WMMD882]WBB79816.1 AfsR/SARP family transcriptional regulator [Micromonospora sp. WMMD882]